jgi:hypothetical protein
VEDLTFDIDDIKPSALKRLLKHALIKGSKSEKAKAKAEESEDKEREDLADLSESSKGPSHPPKVTRSDIPVQLRNADEGADEEEEEDEKPEVPAKKKAKVPFKGKKQSFPFKKKG